ncbi:glycoside hydrolase family 64 protein [Venturia nashicola]|uniref:Glycoside hydrolase family 64 protein n=1 Tax=Venturia nashicola TaxID=86259 RepID=A0A4Z1P5R6_9PEZI|nr:glycoside hydrolase family 64 protein [Venturia nashicola]
MWGSLMPTLFIATQLIRTSLALPTPYHGDVQSTRSETYDIRAASNPDLTATLVTPGEIILTDKNTLKSTTSTNTTILKNTQNSSSLSLALINNLEGKVNAYVTGLTPTGQLVMLQPDGTFFYPTCSSGQTTPLLITTNTAIPLGAKGSTTNINIPGYISAGRVWFAADDILKFYIVWNVGTNSPTLVLPSAANPSDASAGVDWGFVELTYTKDGLFANISYVDFVGLVLGIRLEESGQAGANGVQVAQGLKSNSLKSICDALGKQTGADGFEWGKLCLTDSKGTVLRVLSPSQYISSHETAFAKLWTGYVDKVWKQYQSQVLTIDTQSGAGKISCQVSESDNLFHCDGSSSTYARPSTTDIFGCNDGPFVVSASANDIHKAVVPRLCAAFHRSTFLSNGGNVQPSLPATSYYGEAATNWYSKTVHQFEGDGRGYAFAYDDVNPSGGEDASGSVTSGNPGVLRVFVGGMV